RRGRLCSGITLEKPKTIVCDCGAVVVKRDSVAVRQTELGAAARGIVDVKILPPEDSPAVGHDGFGFDQCLADSCARFQSEGADIPVRSNLVFARRSGFARLSRRTHVAADRNVRAPVLLLQQALLN